MKAFNTLQLLRQITDPVLYEAAHKGFLSIYESNETSDPFFLSLVDMPYEKALEAMTEYMSQETTFDGYRDRLSPLANAIALREVALKPKFKEFENYAEERFDDNEFVFLMGVIDEIVKVMSGNNTYDEYAELLPESALVELAMLFEDEEEMTKQLNFLIHYQKMNLLIHKVKNTFMPVLMQMAK